MANQMNDEINLPLARQAAPQVGVTDERRNIAGVKRTGDMGLSIRFLSARACSAFERYLAAPQAASREPIYQIQFYSEQGSSVWHDAFETAYHATMPERRRIVYAAHQAASHIVLVPDGDDDYSCVRAEPQAATTAGAGYSKEWSERMLEKETSFGGNIEAGATTASASIDTAEFRRLSYAYAEALFKGTVPETSTAWAALVEHIDGRATAPSRDAAALPIRPLRNDVDHAAALAEVQKLMLTDLECGSPESDRLEVLAALIEVYELQHFPVLPAVQATLPDGWAMVPVAAQQGAARAPLDDNEVARLRRVIRALDMERETPDDDETLRGCLFSVLGQIAYKLESRAAQAAHAGAGTERDAARYRWLRQWSSGKRLEVFRNSATTTELDTSIDAAMSAATEQGERP